MSEMTPRERQLARLNMTGAERIAAERQRQIDVEGYDAEHDDEHPGGELALAAHCYLGAGDEAAFAQRTGDDLDGPIALHSDWPWEPAAWKPSHDPIRNYERAGALLAAEIDRLRRRA